ncbi:MAG TPA: helix-turn-helix domain-containing protein [Actinomycetes bacterium]|nr:helix-turn-helix domain-containing protein [Actinomycetes bacterium]
MATPAVAVSAETVRRLERSSGALATDAITRMEERLPWYRAMTAEQRSWVGLIAQAGIAAFVAWMRSPDDGFGVTAEVFGLAPRELARAITLQQTVELVRTTIDVVEEQVDALAEPESVPLLREAVLRYSREVAFAAADVYAQAAEARGAWDARIEALVVDALLRGEVDEGVRSRAAGLGWTATSAICVVVGQAPQASPEDVADGLHRAARHAHVDVVVGVQGERLVVVLGRVDDPLARARALLPHFGPGPVVVGPVAADLAGAVRSASAALSGSRAVAAWPDAPRPVLAEDLLAERALAGDQEARRRLVAEVHDTLVAARGDLAETVSAYLEQAGSLEGTARLLYVHPNTVRYRLRRVSELTGVSPTTARGAFVTRLALALGRLDGAQA